MSYRIILTFLFMFFACAESYGVITAADRAELSNENLLVGKNPGFESGKTGWTASAGATALVTSGTSLGWGAGSLTWDPTAAAQSLCSSTVTIPKGFYGQPGLAYCHIKTTTGSSTLTIEAHDGTSIIGSAATVPNASYFAKGLVQFTWPTSGSGRICIRSTANEPLVAIDNCFMGLAVDQAATQYQTASRAMVTDTAGKPTTATTTATEIGYVAASARSLQDQLNEKSKNYIYLNSDAEVGTTGWAAYVDAAGVIPVDGTGGSPSSTWTRTTSSPLRNTGSFLWTKTAVNRQGEGVSYDFTIDAADKGKVLQGAFDYAIASGTYADDDLQVFVYDVTNSALIYANPQKLKNHTLAADRFFFEFQTASSSTSYRLVIHTASTSALAYTVKFDNFSVGPQPKLYGSADTDWKSYTPTTAGFGTVSNMTAYWRKVGDSMEVRATFTSGTVSATTAKVSLPTGYTWTLTSASNELVGYLTIGAGTSASSYTVIAAAGDPSNFQFGRFNAAESGLSPRNGDAIFPGTSVISFFATVPILGWSSSQVLSSDASTRAISFHASASTNTTIAASSSATKVAYDTVVHDTHGGYSTSNKRYTIPVSGYYKVYFSARYDSVAWTALDRLDFIIYKNNASFKQLESMLMPSTGTYYGGLAHGTATNYYNAGDYIEIFAVQPQAGTRNLIADASVNYWGAEQVQGPAQIAASEAISALYTGAPPTGTLNSSLNTITFGTKVTDTHGAYSSGTYTVPASGKYSVQCATAQAATYSAANNAIVSIHINGTRSYDDNIVLYGTAGTVYPNISVHSVPLVAGDLVTCKSANSGTTPTFGSNAYNNYFSIVRTGI